MIDLFVQGNFYTVDPIKKIENNKTSSDWLIYQLHWYGSFLSVHWLNPPVAFESLDDEF